MNPILIEEERRIQVGGGDEGNIILLIQSETYSGDSTVLDNSPAGRSLSNYGAAHSNSYAKFGSTSLHFDGPDYLLADDHADFNLGTNDFTIDFWLLMNSGLRKTVMGQTLTLSGSTDTAWWVEKKGVPDVIQFTMCQGTTVFSLQAVTSALGNVWNHYGICRDGNSLRLYVNGVQEATKDVTGVTMNNSTRRFGIGSAGDYFSNNLMGYLEEVRIINDTCMYPNGDTFIPPVTPY